MVTWLAMLLTHIHDTPVLVLLFLFCFCFLGGFFVNEDAYTYTRTCTQENLPVNQCFVISMKSVKVRMPSVERMA